MEERRAVALAQRHRAHLQLRDACGPKRVAVERGVRAGLRQRRHHIGEGPERAASRAQHAAGKTWRRQSRGARLPAAAGRLRSVKEKARPRASTHWMRSGAGGPG